MPRAAPAEASPAAYSAEAAASAAKAGSAGEGRSPPGVAAQGPAPPAAAAPVQAPPELRLPLSSSDVELYRSVFGAQDAARWTDAEREMKLIQDQSLFGHVLRERYLHPSGYRASYQELVDWLKKYADHPGAEQVHKLALMRKPAKSAPPPPPLGAGLGEFAREAQAPSMSEGRPVAKARDTKLQRAISAAEAVMQREIRRGRVDFAERQLDRPEIRAGLSPSEYDDWRRRVAAGYFAHADDLRAFMLAEPAAKRSRQRVPRADWIAGLAAWRLGRLDNALHHFEELAHSTTASTWEIAAGAYWASRIMLKLSQPREVNRLLLAAAAHPRTFYGLLAVRQLGPDLPFAWTEPPLAPEDARRLATIPAARRAIALNQIGQTLAAERELRRLQASANERLAGLLLGLSARLDTPAATLKLAQAWAEAKGEYYDAALYPLPPWQPRNGFTVERALVYALMRQESAFNTRALSPVGASGLMQLMPGTARFVGGDKKLGGRDGRARLFAPEVNMELGQRYLQHLLEHPAVRGNLFMLAVAYNAGPGNLQRWLKTVQHQDDPLLFIEAIPAAETRNFVERVLVNLWIYQTQLGQPTASLESVAAGFWPQYVQALAAPDAEPEAEIDYGIDTGIENGFDNRDTNDDAAIPD